MDYEDIDALLEAPFQSTKDDTESSTTVKHSKKSLSNSSLTSSNREEDHHRHHHRRGGDGRRRSRSPDNRKSRHYRNRSRSPESGSSRDKKTVFVTQLAQRVRSPELYDFFRSIGSIRGARVVFDKISKRSKGVGYVEFEDEKSVPKAIGMTGRKLCGIPIVVQPSEAEKNKLAEEAALEQERLKKSQNGATNRLYVGSIHFGLSAADLKKVFEPFGEIEDITMTKDPVTGKFKGVAYIQYCDEKDAKRALDTMNGFELAGRQLKVGIAHDQAGTSNSVIGGGGGSLTTPGSSLNNANGNSTLDDSETMGMSMNALSRVDLMKRLAAGRGGVDTSTTTSSSSSSEQKAAGSSIQKENITNLPATFEKSDTPTRCLMLTNMYNPLEESDPNWMQDIEEEVKEECEKHGKVIHAHVPGSMNGQVLLAFASVSASVAVQAEMNARFFAGRQLTASFLRESSYFSQFDI